jgi:hypothetical protein
VVAGDHPGDHGMVTRIEPDKLWLASLSPHLQNAIPFLLPQHFLTGKASRCSTNFGLPKRCD